MQRLFGDFLKLERDIIYVILAEFMVQFINSAFLAIQPLYMQHEGFTDGQSADFISYRFLGVLLLAVPLGLYLRGRKIKPLFYLSCAGVPTFALLIVEAIRLHHYPLLYVSQFLWGVSLALMQIPVLPFILRNARQESHTGGITLSYATWSFASIASGFFIASLSSISHSFFNERVMLLLVSVIGFTGLFFIYKIRSTEQVPVLTQKRSNLADYDWPVIIRALTPTLFIAVGAGFTIPFISLFFKNVHHFTTGEFSFVNTLASCLIALGALLVPFIKKRIGYAVAIPVTQSLAIIALIAMATTQYYNEYTFAAGLAVIFFLLRQPLMNLAGPMTSEVVMKYAGKKNQEIISGLTSAIWSSWFISSKIFGWLRDAHYTYASIFLITAILYSAGVIWYYYLVKEYQQKLSAGFIEP